MRYAKIILLLFASVNLIAAKPKVERADIRHWERYDETQTCIMTFHRPKNLKNYNLIVKKRWQKFRRTSFKHSVIITHPICSDKEWYKRGGMFKTRPMDRYVKIFGVQYKRSRGG